MLSELDKYSTHVHFSCVASGFFRDQYELLSSEPVGVGAYAAVYHARQRATGKEVALKCIPRASRSPYSSVDVEVEALTRVRGHSHIVSLEDVFTDDAHTYLALEYCSNGTLQDYLARNGPVSEEQAQKWFSQLVHAVAFCQEHGVMNQDLKNENVLLSKNMNVKVADFGLCILTDGDVNQTRTTRAGGSPVFAAPEVYGASLNGIAFRPAVAESWALGVILHSMLVGELPFSVRHYQRTWMRYSAPEHLSATCQDLLQHLLKHTPSARLTVAQLLNHPWLETEDSFTSSDEDAVSMLRGRGMTCRLAKGADALKQMDGREGRIRGQKTVVEVGN